MLKYSNMADVAEIKWRKEGRKQGTNEQTNERTGEQMHQLIDWLIIII